MMERYLSEMSAGFGPHLYVSEANIIIKIFSNRFFSDSLIQGSTNMFQYMLFTVPFDVLSVLIHVP